jgi:ferrous iron transport protein B
VLETPRQRFVTATLITIAVPCAAMQAMIVGLVGVRGIIPVVIVYAALFVVWVAVSVVLRFTSRDFRPEMLIEIPPYRLPTVRTTMSKLLHRTRGFLREALPIIAGAVLAVNLLEMLGAFSALSAVAAPLVTRLWGLPAESVVPLTLGILRKDVAMGMLAPLSLTTTQLVTATVVLAMFFPCLATLAVLLRENGIRNGLKSIAIMLAVVVATGTLLRLILPPL